MACYSLQNCTSGNTWNINYAPGGLSLGDVIAIAPDASGELVNCWSVTGTIFPCTGSESTVYSITNYGAGVCPTCEESPKIYKLVSCDELTILYTYTPLGTFVNGYMGNVDLYEGECFYVTESVGVPPPTVVITGAFATCNCIPCYRVENCMDTSIFINISTAVALPAAPNAFELSPNPTAPLVPLGTPNCWRLVGTVPCSFSEPSFTIVTSYETCDDCMLDKQCYALTKCGDSTPTVYTKTNLFSYVGTQITSPELGGNCYTVALSASCITPVVLNSTLITACSCPPAGNCYLLALCDSDGAITLNVSLTPPATLITGNVYNIFPVPTIPPGYDNCWQVVGAIPCELTFYAVSSVNSFASCAACQTPPTCYKLTACNGYTIYTEDVVIAPFLNTYVQLPGYPGYCFYVTEVLDGTCGTPVPITGTPTSCSCPCYILTDCFDTVAPIYTHSNLAAYVGTQVHIDEAGGCSGLCYLVELSPVPCPEILPTVTVTLDCPACPPCKPPTCYTLVDCVTKVPFMTLNNPTLNSIDLGPLLGQVVSKICEDEAGLICDYGCWTIATGDCGNADLPAQDMYVYNIFPDCPSCLNSCYEFVNCTTGAVAYTVQNTNNSLGLPSLNTLIGATITDLCFEGDVCPPGCFYIRQKENRDCTGSISYDTVISFNVSETYCCQTTCYILEACDGSIPPFIVSNDLSAYISPPQIINACYNNADLGDICKCFIVSRSTSCEESVVLDTIIDSFDTCEACRYCGCPEGYTQVDDQCQKVVTVPATLSATVYTVNPGSKNIAYGSLGANFYGNISALPGPIVENGSGQFVDAGSNAIVPTPPGSAAPGSVWGPGFTTSRLNTVGVWSTAAPNPVNEWVGFTHCVTIEQTGTYCIGLGGDNGIRFSIDGTVLVTAVNNITFNFNFWHVFEVTLTAGTHIISVEGYNFAGDAAFGAEIYNATAATLAGYTTTLQVDAVTVFSTFDKIGDNFDIGQNSGYTCPAGFTLGFCNGEPDCTGIQTTPYVPCLPSYKVTTCPGEVSLPPFITNTDLSAFVGGTYKICIDNPEEYATNCFFLRDCNNVYPDMNTYTDLTTYLWQSVTLLNYPGGCFIVQGVPVGSLCRDAEEVVVEEVCACPNAETPWPNGCYCVTVEEIDYTIGTEFTAEFTTEFENCEACLQKCYTLTACAGGVSPINVCNDLSAYLDPPRVIKITGCGDICWIVTEGDCVAQPQYIDGTITEFDDCPSCLPPVPPTPPLVLHPRAITPGYFSPNSTISTDYIERVNCMFAKLVYDQMLEARYGITTCCKGDLPKWDIKKQYLDMELLTDPSLCKSTLCHCPEPCFVSAFITLLPTCIAPYLVEVLLDTLCFAPVVESVEITVESTLSCYCFTIEVLETPVTVGYIDCCCKDVIATYDVATTINACAIYPPVASNPGGVNVTSSGFCSDACVVPPPVCICWEIVNNTYEAGINALVNFTPCGLETAYNVIMEGPTLNVCSYNMPTGDNITVTNLSPCALTCNTDCRCFLLTFENPTVDFQIFDCELQEVTTVTLTSPYYACSATVPIPLTTATGLSMTLVDPTAFICVGALRCAAVVLPCKCWSVVLDVEESVTGDCNGDIISITNTTPSIGTFFICSQGTPVSSGTGAITLISNNCDKPCTVPTPA